MTQLNGILEDLSAVIGYTATTTLIDFLGGKSLYVPQEAHHDHMLSKLIGGPAFKALSREYGNEVLNLPFDYRRERNQRNRLIGALVQMGVGVSDVARTAGISTRQVDHVILELRTIGILQELEGTEDLLMHEPQTVALVSDFDNENSV